jgi:hypothetical protein
VAWSSAAEIVGFVQSRNGVIVDDTKNRFVPMLQLDPVFHRAEVISNVQLARGLDAAKDS